MNDDRRFGIADGLILTAGVGAGLGLVRYIDPGVTPGRLWSVLFEPPGGWTPRYALQVSAELCVLFVTPFVAAWTPACLLVQLKRPRPRRLRRAPGFLACLLPTLGCALTVAITWACLGTTAWKPVHPNQADYEMTQVVGGLLVGSGVLWAWATMAVCGICRARPTWTDRLGRLTGVVWVVIGMLSGGYLLLLI
jgi:hypothetical protein